jgi:ectoine hydroxylase-related dioxygenase (phytanoyl-CoA dioxygenase family)
MNIDLNFYEQNGIANLRNILTQESKANILESILDFANLFKNKIKNKSFNFQIKNKKDLNKFFIKLEKYNKIYLWNFQQHISNLKCINDVILNENLLLQASKILKVKKNNILTQKGLILINLPSLKRNLYKWHNAKNYYQKRNNSIGVWLPLINDKNSKNGSMKIAIGSHNKDYPFLEYQKDKYSSHQQHIPETYFRKYKKKYLNLRFGDVSFMHSNTVHASSENKSKTFSMALVFKYWDISKDHTLSAKIDQKYYSDDNCAGPDVGII